jgi:hypothetical protein
VQETLMRLSHRFGLVNPGELESFKDFVMEKVEEMVKFDFLLLILGHFGS